MLVIHPWKIPDVTTGNVSLSLTSRGQSFYIRINDDTRIINQILDKACIYVCEVNSNYIVFFVNI